MPKPEQERVNLKLELTGLRECDAVSIVKLMCMMNYFGSAGCSRTIKLFVDGDGAFNFGRVLVDGEEVSRKERLKLIGEYDKEDGLDFAFD